jgi:CHAT domain-containing protein
LQSKHFSSISEENPLSLSFQASGTGPILVHVSANEAEFESRIIDALGRSLNEARLPYIRTGPVYQLLDADQHTGQIEIQVSVIHHTKAANISIQIYKLPQEGRADQKMEQAYRHYSNSIQSTDSEATELWRGRLLELQKAASLFRQIGMQEQALWSEFLGANFSYFPLYEFQSAIGVARKIQTQARDAGFPLLELMATHLEGQALIERDDSDSPESAADKFNRAQLVLRESADLALELGMRFEQAWAINTLGIGHYYQDSPKKALEKYQQVLQIAYELQDAYLLNLVGGNIALVNERLGNHAAALEALLAIRQELLHSDLPAERAHNLAEIGRLYSKLFLFPEAIEALAEAMNISREAGSSEGTGHIGLLLAKAYYNMGQVGRAKDIMLPAIDDMKDAHFGRGLREGNRFLADIFRVRGEHTQAETFRERQGQYLVSDRDRAGFLFDQGMDALSADETAHAEAMFAESHKKAVSAGDVGLQIRSLLQGCILVPDSELNNADCDIKRLKNMLIGWVPYAVPKDVLAARYSWAELLAVRGDDAAAVFVLDEMITDIQAYRARLPGVLGAWYWQCRRNVFTTYMDLLLKHAESQQQVAGALLALDRLRNLEVSSHRDEEARARSSTDFKVDEIREMVAGMALSRDDEARLNLRQKIDRLLLGANSASNFHPVENRDLLPILASLPADTALLTYYFSDTGAWVWLAGQQGLRLLHLGDAEPILVLLDKLRTGVRIVGNGGLDQDLETLGDLLIGPLEGALPKTIYLASAGQLAGFPFEAIRSNGRYLAQGHTVINLLSLEGLGKLDQTERAGSEWSEVFLAGAPSRPDGDHTELAGAASEIDDIADLFGTQRVHKISGKNLSRAKFTAPAFSRADLIHIASHGTIDFEYPELSRLILSAQSYGGNTDYLTPLDIRQLSIRADLVVLSACETTGQNNFHFDSNLGFVSEYLQMGAGAVIASLWPVSDRNTHKFMVDFYSEMLKGAQIPEALIRTKRENLHAQQGNSTLNWASFQIYIK